MRAPISEDQILIPRNPAIANSDDWPEFELTNVFIHPLGDPDTCCSLLDAHEFNPLAVTGQLESVPVDLAHLVRKPSAVKRTERIEIAEVRTIAWGQYADGGIALWAAGQAGWFSIKPGRGYRKTFEQMQEAVSLWYTIVDAFKASQLKSKAKDASRTMEDRTDSFLRNAGVREDAVNDYVGFLLSSMIAKKEGITWWRHPLYLYLKGLHPEQHDEIYNRIVGAPKKEKHSKRCARQDSVGSSTSNTNTRQMRGSASRTWSDGSRNEPSHPRLSEKASRTAATRSGPSQNASSQTLTRVIELTQTPSRDSDDQEPSPVRKGKSALRPRSSAAHKGASRGGKTAVAHESDDEEDTPRSSPISVKRKREDEIDFDDKSRFKRSLSSQRKIDQQELQLEDEGIDMPLSPSESIDSDAEQVEDLDGHVLSADQVLHKPDPVQEDTWICALDGCTHKVYAASQPASQRLIREHYTLHAYDDDERVQMVKNLQAPSLPAQHLMERVRPQAKTDGLPGNRAKGQMGPAGDRFPTITIKPVMQRY